MFELTEDRRKFLTAFLTNTATTALAGLIIGSIIREKGFALSLFMAGCIICLIALLACWALNGPEKSEEAEDL